VKNVFQKDAFYYTWLDAAQWPDSEYHFGLAPKWRLLYKNRNSGAKNSVFGRPVVPAVLVDAKWRYGQRWTRCGRIPSESLRSIGRELSWAFKKPENTDFHNFVEHKNKLFSSRNTYCYTWFDAARRAEPKYHLGFALKCFCVRKTNDFGAETWFFGKPLAPSLLTGTTRRYGQW